MSDVLTRILQDRLIAVIRTDSTERLLDVVSALADGGISICEITLTIPNALAAIEIISKRLGDQCLIGAGTVLDAQNANRAIDAGAKFIVSPIVNIDVIRTARQRKTPVMAGAYTPTEIHTAWEAGADIVKVFPADSLGPSYFKAVRGPLPHIRLMPTGGVDLTTAKAFLVAGACCLGVGGKLIDPTAIRNRDFAVLISLAKQFRSIVPIISG